MFKHLFIFKINKKKFAFLTGGGNFIEQLGLMLLNFV